MFDLDQAIEEWRGKVFAAGIRESTSLDELESHLRDHVARLTREGNGVEEAFDAAIQKIGQIDVLKKEFAKAEGWSGWLDYCNSRATQRILALLWMGASCWWLSGALIGLLDPQVRSMTFLVMVEALRILAGTCGMIGGVLLFCGSRWGHRIVRTLAFFMTALCIARVFFLIPRWLEGGPFAGRAIIVCGGLSLFGLITVALLRSSSRPNSSPWINQASVTPALYASGRGETAVIDVNRDPHYRGAMPRLIHQKVLAGGVTCLFAAALLVVLGGPWFWMHRIRTLQDSPFAQDPRFVVTTLPLTGVRNYSFSPGPRATCSIHGLLQQCTEVTGVRYVVAKEVAAGEVEFGGSTNTLTARQWAQAFTDALQHDQPRWRDFRTQRFHEENLVLLTNDARTVLVLPKAMAQEFEKRGGN